MDDGQEEFGLGAESRSRQVIVKDREAFLSKVFKKSLEDIEDQSTKEARCWSNRDKLTTAVLLNLPGPHNSWSSRVRRGYVPYISPTLLLPVKGSCGKNWGQGGGQVGGRGHVRHPAGRAVSSDATIESSSASVPSPHSVDLTISASHSQCLWLKSPKGP